MFPKNYSMALEEFETGDAGQDFLPANAHNMHMDGAMLFLSSVTKTLPLHAPLKRAVITFSLQA